MSCLVTKNFLKQRFFKMLSPMCIVHSLTPAEIGLWVSSLYSDISLYLSSHKMFDIILF